MFINKEQYNKLPNELKFFLKNLEKIKNGQNLWVVFGKLSQKNKLDKVKSL